MSSCNTHNWLTDSFSCFLSSGDLNMFTTDFRRVLLGEVVCSAALVSVTQLVAFMHLTLKLFCLKHLFFMEMQQGYAEMVAKYTHINSYVTMSHISAYQIATVFCYTYLPIYGAAT